MLLRILQLLPTLLEAVRAVEMFLPLPGHGKEKLALVLGIIEDTQTDIEAIRPIIVKVIGRIVGFANRTGEFATPLTK